MKDFSLNHPDLAELIQRTHDRVESLYQIQEAYMERFEKPNTVLDRLATLDPILLLMADEGINEQSVLDIGDLAAQNDEAYELVHEWMVENESEERDEIIAELYELVYAKGFDRSAKK